MAGTLKARLERARELARSRRDSPPGMTGIGGPGNARPGPDRLETETDTAPGSSWVLQGWTKSAPYVLTRSVLRENPLPETLDIRPYLYPGTVPAVSGKGKPEAGTADPDPSAIPAARLRFLDLETTGLSGGAGTVAFLAALGRIAPGPAGSGLEIRQFLLTDYPGERAFLDAIKDQLAPEDILVSYNGRAFDEPLLRTRCVLNRIAFPSLPHIDFLHPARRLWRGRYPDCSLGTLERAVLGRTRVLDVPGEKIPEIWFAYSREGRHPLMDAVAEHNATDIESLAGIAAACGRAYSRPLDEPGCNRAVLGAYLLRLDAERGVEILEKAFREGEEKAGWLLLLHYRRGSASADYERILSALTPSLRVLLEQAKYFEHRLRDYQKARSAANEALADAGSPGARAALAHRLARLERKLAAIPRLGDRRVPRH